MDTLLATAPAPSGVAPEVWALHERVAAGDRMARAPLIEEYYAYACSLARRFYRSNEPLEDLEQVALEALLRAIDRFDPTRGMPFVGFATPTIIGTLKRHFRDHGWAIKVPRRVHELSSPLKVATEMLEQDLEREPTVFELADFLGVTVEQIEEAWDAGTSRTPRSLDDPDVGRSVPLSSATAELHAVEDRATVEAALNQLSAEERRLLARYFRDGWTQSQIAEELGRSQIHVSRLLSRTLERLRAHL